MYKQLIKHIKESTYLTESQKAEDIAMYEALQSRGELSAEMIAYHIKLHEEAKEEME